MINTRRILAAIALSALALGASACSPKAGQQQSDPAASATTPGASASPTQAPPQSDAAAQSGASSEGNQTPGVNVTDDEARCDLANLQPAVASRQEAGGTTYVELSFTNEGPACWIGGFPSVVFSSAGATAPGAVRDGEDPGNVYTIAEGGRVGVTLTAEAVDGVEGCTPTDIDLVDVSSDGGGASTSLQLPLRVCQEIPSVAVSPFEPRP